MTTDIEYDQLFKAWCKKDDARRGDISKIKIETGSYGFEVKTPYNQGFITEIKRLKGTRWNPEKKVWYVPAEWSPELNLAIKNNFISKSQRGKNCNISKR